MRARAFREDEDGLPGLVHLVSGGVEGLAGGGAVCAVDEDSLTE